MVSLKALHAPTACLWRLLSHYFNQTTGLPGISSQPSAGCTSVIALYPCQRTCTDNFSVTKSIKIVHPGKEHSAEETTGRISAQAGAQWCWYSPVKVSWRSHSSFLLSHHNMSFLKKILCMSDFYTVWITMPKYIKIVYLNKINILQLHCLKLWCKITSGMQWFTKLYTGLCAYLN